MVIENERQLWWSASDRHSLTCTVQSPCFIASLLRVCSTYCPGTDDSESNLTEYGVQSDARWTQCRGHSRLQHVIPNISDIYAVFSVAAMRYTHRLIRSNERKSRRRCRRWGQMRDSTHSASIWYPPWSRAMTIFNGA